VKMCKEGRRNEKRAGREKGSFREAMAGEC
jgi:hypothetical protein